MKGLSQLTVPLNCWSSEKEFSLFIFNSKTEDEYLWQCQNLEMQMGTLFEFCLGLLIVPKRPGFGVSI